MNKPAPDGAFIDGLFIEGCRWDEEQGVLAESHPKVLITKMPRVWIKPTEISKLDHGHAYECPLYKTSARAGVLSTTGASTNFVVALSIPTREPPEKWVRMGIAALCQTDD